MPGNSLLWLLCLLLPSLATANEISILNRSPRDGTIVKEGSSVRLSCRTDTRWFFCLWRSPAQEKSCAIQQSANSPPFSVCEADERIQIRPGVTNCDLVIEGVRAEDFGGWMCVVNEPEAFDSAKAVVKLEVAQPVTVKFVPSFGVKNELTITEGDEQEVGRWQYNFF